MFEPLVSSRIRRILLEYVLSHPHERFYLRGLARQLNLTISPLRRELKRLEQLGVLTATEEANVRMYVVNCASPYFTQLQSAAGSPTAVGSALGAPRPDPSRGGQGSGSLVAVAQSVERRVRPWPVVVSLAGLGVVMIGAMAYLVLANQRLLAVARPPARVTVAHAAPRTSSEMHSARWKLLPGSFGGFSSGAESQESY